MGFQEKGVEAPAGSRTRRSLAALSARVQPNASGDGLSPSSPTLLQAHTPSLHVLHACGCLNCQRASPSPLAACIVLCDRTWLRGLRLWNVEPQLMYAFLVLCRCDDSAQTRPTLGGRWPHRGCHWCLPTPHHPSLHDHAPCRSGDPHRPLGRAPHAKHAPAPSHAARCRCPLLVHAPRYPPLTFGRTWRAKREASHNDPGRYRHLLFELRMLVLFDACGYACVWSGCAERVLHAHVAVDRLPHSRLLRPISLYGRK